MSKETADKVKREQVVPTTKRVTAEAALPPEVLETAFMQAVRQIEQAGLKFHAEIHHKNGLDRKLYHDLDHPTTLEKRARLTAKALELTPEQYGIVRMAIAFHDTVIAYEQATPGVVTATIKRKRGALPEDAPDGKGDEGNEARSAQLLEIEMRHASPPFTVEQIKIAMLAIHATYVVPEFNKDFTSYDREGKLAEQNTELAALINELKGQHITTGSLFSQVHLERTLEKRASGQSEKVAREVIITALVDLGAAGCAHPEEFFKEGDEEFWELYGNLRNKNIMSRLQTGTEKNDVQDRKKVVMELTKWLDGQPGFAVFQALRFEKIIYLLKQQNDITKKEEQALRDQFNQFTHNIRTARDRAGRLKSEYNTQLARGEKEAFTFLIDSMHYTLEETT